jgi:hypothetical protein
MVSMRNKFRINHESGQDMLEFALILPILALLVVGIFDLGRVVFFYSSMQNAAREGARLGVVHPWQENLVVSRTKDRTLGITPGELSVLVTYTCDHVKVRVGYDFDPITPIAENINISTSSHLQRERWLAGNGQADQNCTPGL